MSILQIRELMHTDVVTISPAESAALAARLLARHNIGSLPVCTSGGRLHGFLTDRDIILRCVAAEEDPFSLPVSHIMTRRCVSVSPEDDIRQAAHVMAAEQVRRLPVVENGKLVGVVSLGDLARCGRYSLEISEALSEISENVHC